MNVGFTGTRDGMTELQHHALRKILRYFGDNRDNSFHFGLCLGADEEAALAAKRLGYSTVAYPSTDSKQTSNFTPDIYAQEPKYPTKRNPDIVRASELMIATPGQFFEIVRSGTWATIREARDRQKKRLVIVWPDGSESWYN
jgi:hypothetical protein